MIPTSLPIQSIATHITEATGAPFQAHTAHVLSGGCINSAIEIADNSMRYFVKYNATNKLDMFLAEADGLHELKHSGTIKVPDVICAGKCDDIAYLVLERLDLGHTTINFSKLGTALAQLHKVTQNDFGWWRDNTIGTTPQINTATHHWVDFWRTHRLGFQLELAEKNGYGEQLHDKGNYLKENLGYFFTEYMPKASLLHGDLWLGNVAMTTVGDAAIYDPAVYYGDHETDLAMLELFGQVPREFYVAYNNVFKIDTGFEARKELYNLYHILNHLNLFGGGYLNQAIAMLNRLLAHIKKNLHV